MNAKFYLPLFLLCSELYNLILTDFTLVFFFAILPIVLRMVALFVIKVSPTATAELALKDG